MSFVGFLRILLLPAVFTLTAICVVQFLKHLIVKESKDENLTAKIAKAAYYTTVAMVVIFAISATFLAVTNLIPRATIDRTSVDQQTNQWQQNHK
jgi:hypothetical protein